MFEIFFRKLGTLKTAAIWESSNSMAERVTSKQLKERSMYELSDSELDMVTGGAQGNAFAFGGLIAAAIGAGVEIGDVTVSALNNNRVDIANGSFNQNNVPIGIAVAILGQSANFIRTNA